MKTLRPVHYLMLAILALSAYQPTLHLGFLWDDHVMIEANPHLRHWSRLELRHDFTTDVFDGHGDPYYRPVQTLMNRVDYSLWGLHPLGYHLTNFLGHVGNTLMTVQLGLVLGLTPMGAFLAGSIVAVHPIVVEQLMIVAGRAEIFGLFLTLAALYFLLRPGRRAAALGIACFVIALFLKESAVAIPALLALCFWFLRRPARDYARLIPCAVLIIPYLAIRHAAVGPLGYPFDAAYIGKFFLIAFPHVVWTYVRLLIMPWNLHSHRLVPRLSHIWALYLISWPLVVAGLWRARSRWGLFVVGWLLICLLPKTPVMIFGNFMLDHWAYPALIGVAFWMGHLLHRAWTEQHRFWARVAIPLYLVFLVVWALFVHLNVALRGTDEKMYRWALNFTTSNPIRYNLGILLLQTGRPMEGAEYLELVHANYPDNVNATYALALCFEAGGHPKAARFYLRQLHVAHPDFAPATDAPRRLQHTLKK